MQMVYANRAMVIDAFVVVTCLRDHIQLTHLTSDWIDDLYTPEMYVHIAL